MIFNELSKILIIFGVILIVIGILLLFLPKIPLIGRLPGDIYIEKENFKFYFPIVSSIIISAIVSAVLYLIYLIRK